MRDRLRSSLQSLSTRLLLEVCLLLTFAASNAAPFEPEAFDTTPLGSESSTAAPLLITPKRDRGFEVFRDYGHASGRAAWQEGLDKDGTPPEKTPAFEEYTGIKNYSARTANEDSAYFIKGRYNRSRARLPENIERWRQQPDIANPGPDLANFPNSAFTLPEGRVYLEASPFSYYGLAKGSEVQYNMEYLLRYGATDNIELRLFGNGPTWTGNPYSSWSFSPLAFDAKIQMWTEKPDLYLPATGFEAYIQTQWLGNTATNSGTQPGFTFNFDQSLPLDIDLEYNIGAIRERNYRGENEWTFSFQWGLQRDFFHKDFALFVHGFVNAMTLPRLPRLQIPANDPFQRLSSLEQHAVGGGFIWTVDSRVAIYAQASGGTNKYTPALISYAGFAIAF